MNSSCRTIFEGEKKRVLKEEENKTKLEFRSHMNQQMRNVRRKRKNYSDYPIPF